MTAERLGYRPGLDGLRAVAVAGVVWVHLFPGPLLEAGNVGVTLFFVLSGFLITRLLLDEIDERGRIDMRSFYQRRGRRLLPAVAPVLIVGLAVNQWTGSPLKVPVMGLLVYSTNWLIVEGHNQGAFGHFWSLAVEEQFYLAWPLLIAAAGHRQLVAKIAVVAAVAVLAMRLSTDGTALRYHATHLRADALMIGAVAGCLAVRRPTRGMVIAAAAVLVVACSGQVAHLTMTWGLTVVALASLVLVEAALKWSPPAAVVWFGRMSYAIYLWNGVIAVALRGTPLPVRLLGLGANVGLAMASARLIEHRRLGQDARATGRGTSGSDRADVTGVEEDASTGVRVDGPVSRCPGSVPESDGANPRAQIP